MGCKKLHIAYYPFGWKLPGRNLEGSEGYRYGYQGQFAEKDDETGWNQFEAWMYDSRIGIIPPLQNEGTPFNMSLIIEHAKVIAL